VLGTTVRFKNMFGTKQQVTRCAISSARRPHGAAIRRRKPANLTSRRTQRRHDCSNAVGQDVRSTGSGSINVYNAKGYFEANPQNAYSLNNITAKKETDGSVKVQSRMRRQVPTACRSSGWNYIVRLYRPRCDPERT